MKTKKMALLLLSTFATGWAAYSQTLTKIQDIEGKPYCNGIPIIQATNGNGLIVRINGSSAVFMNNTGAFIPKLENKTTCTATDKLMYEVEYSGGGILTINTYDLATNRKKGSRKGTKSVPDAIREDPEMKKYAKYDYFVIEKAAVLDENHLFLTFRCIKGADYMYLNFIADINKPDNFSAFLPSLPLVGNLKYTNLSSSTDTRFLYYDINGQKIYYTANVVQKNKDLKRIDGCYKMIQVFDAQEHGLGLYHVSLLSDSYVMDYSPARIDAADGFYRDVVMDYENNCVYAINYVEEAKSKQKALLLKKFDITKNAEVWKYAYDLKDTKVQKSFESQSANAKLSHSSKNTLELNFTVGFNNVNYTFDANNGAFVEEQTMPALENLKTDVTKYAVVPELREVIQDLEKKEAKNLFDVVKSNSKEGFVIFVKSGRTLVYKYSL